MYSLTLSQQMMDFAWSRVCSLLRMLGSCTTGSRYKTSQINILRMSSSGNSSVLSELVRLSRLGHSRSCQDCGQPGLFLQAQHGTADAIQSDTWHRQSLDHHIPLTTGRSTVVHSIWSDRILHLQVSIEQPDSCCKGRLRTNPIVRRLQSSELTSTEMTSPHMLIVRAVSGIPSASSSQP